MKDFQFLNLTSHKVQSFIYEKLINFGQNENFAKNCMSEKINLIYVDVVFDVMFDV